MNHLRKHVLENLKATMALEKQEHLNTKEQLELLNNNTKLKEGFLNACCNDLVAIQPLLNRYTRLYEGSLKADILHEINNILQIEKLKELN